MQEIKLCGGEFIELMEDFYEAASMGNVVKLPYSIWQKFNRCKQMVQPCDTVRITLSSNAKNDTDYFCWIFINSEGIHNFKIDKAEDFVIKYLLPVSKRIWDVDSPEKNKEKENDNIMKFNFDFGTCKDDNVKLSIYGIAVKNKVGTYVSYNPSTKEIIDVDILNFNGGQFLFKMPVAIKDIAAGDVIIHNRVPVFVTDVSDCNVSGIDVFAGEQKIILPTKSPFGLNFVTKIVSLMSAFGSTEPSPDAPFGNMLPLFMMNDNEDFDPMMLMFMMNTQNMDMNPMMMYCMMNSKRGDTNDLMPFFMMQMMNKQ